MTKKYFYSVGVTLAVSLTALLTWSCATTKAPERVSKEPPAVAERATTESPQLKSGDLTQVTTSADVKAAQDEVEKQLAKLRDKKSEEPAAGEPSITLKPAPEAKATEAKAKHEASEEAVGVDPEKALGWLKNGNTRFVKQRLRSDGQSMADIKRLSKGQKPHTIVVSCSDSRVPPEILFDQKLGEIFVIRTAGESLDAMGIGSIEYALAHLGARHVLILGHTHCGAVKAACSTLAGGDAGSESLNALVHDIHPRLSNFKDKKEFSKGYTEETWANAKGAAVELVDRSEIVHKMLEEKKISISTAIYDIETGKVDFNK